MNNTSENIPAHFTVACIIAFFFLGDSNAHTFFISSDTSRITDIYFNSHDTLLYEPVCANGQTYLNEEVARLDGATDPKKGYCPSYSKVSVVDPNRFWIAGVELNGIKEASGAEGYSNNSNIVFEIFKDGSNVLSLQPDSNCAGVQQWKAWIDFDGNQVFDPEELIVDVVAGGIALPFYLPQELLEGTLTRMRIFTGQRGADLLGDTVVTGEVEDYTVQVVE